MIFKVKRERAGSSRGREGRERGSSSFVGIGSGGKRRKAGSAGTGWQDSVYVQQCKGQVCVCVWCATCGKSGDVRVGVWSGREGNRRNSACGGLESRRGVPFAVSGWPVYGWGEEEGGYASLGAVEREGVRARTWGARSERYHTGM